MSCLYSVALRVDWRVSNILLNDDKIVDFTVIFGDDFPIAKNILASKSYNADSPLSLAILPCDHNRKRPSYDGSVMSTEGVSSTLRDEGSVSGMPERCMEEEIESYVSGNQIRILLEPHEGREISSTPYNILPKQMVIYLYLYCLVVVFVIDK